MNSPVLLPVSRPGSKTGEEKSRQGSALPAWFYPVVGLTISLPWAAVTSCGAFFEQRISGGRVADPTLHTLATSFLTHMASLYLAVKLVGMLACMRWVRRVPSERFMLVGLGGIVAGMLALGVVAAIPHLQSAAFYGISLALCTIVASAVAGLEAGAYTSAGLCASVEFVMLGQSTSGVVGALLVLLLTIATTDSRSKFASSVTAVVSFLAVAAVSIIPLVKLAATAKQSSTRGTRSETRFNWQWTRTCWREVVATLLSSSSQLIVVPFVVSRTSAVALSAEVFRPASFLVVAGMDFVSRVATLIPRLRKLSLPVLPLTVGRTVLMMLPLVIWRRGDNTYFMLLAMFAASGGYLSVATTDIALSRVDGGQRGAVSAGLAILGLAGAILGALMSALLAILL